MSRQDIRTPALAGGAVIGLLLANEYLCQALRKLNSNEIHD
ncbi:hypothetical protein [Bradyrhizobium liaoningense]